MNKKLEIALIIFACLFVIYLAFNPAWITKPKYMIDKKYCEVDSDCRVYSCDSINIYNYKENRGVCLRENFGTKCNNNKCDILFEEEKND